MTSQPQPETLTTTEVLEAISAPSIPIVERTAEAPVDTAEGLEKQADHLRQRIEGHGRKTIADYFDLGGVYLKFSTKFRQTGEWMAYQRKHADEMKPEPTSRKIKVYREAIRRHGNYGDAKTAVTKFKNWTAVEKEYAPRSPRTTTAVKLATNAVKVLEESFAALSDEQRIVIIARLQSLIS